MSHVIAPKTCPDTMTQPLRRIIETGYALATHEPIERRGEVVAG